MARQHQSGRLGGPADGRGSRSRWSVRNGDNVIPCHLIEIRRYLGTEPRSTGGEAMAQANRPCLIYYCVSQGAGLRACLNWFEGFQPSSRWWPATTRPQRNRAQSRNCASHEPGPLESAKGRVGRPVTREKEITPPERLLAVGGHCAMQPASYPRWRGRVASSKPAHRWTEKGEEIDDFPAGSISARAKQKLSTQVFGEALNNARVMASN